MPTDTLVTILQIQGVAQAVASLQAVGAAAQNTSNSLLRLTTIQAPLTGGMLRLNLANTLAAGGFTTLATAGFLAFQALRGVGQAMSEDIRLADTYSQSLARTLVLLNNAGRAAAPNQLAGLARQRLGALGIPEERTLGLVGRLGELGFNQQRIGQLVPALQNVEAGTGGRITEERALSLILRAIERPAQGGRGGRAGGAGGTRGLLSLATQLGVNIRLTGSFERDLQNLTEAINSKFGGVAAALANTASGVHLRFQANLTAATSRLGQIMEVALLPVLEVLNTQLQGFSRTVDILLHPGGRGESAVQNTLHGLSYLPGVGFLFARLADARGREAALNRIDPKQQRIGEDIHKIAQNTDQMAGAMAQVLFGHAGPFTRQAFAYNELNRAIQGRR